MKDGADAYETVNRVRHWQVFLGSAIMIALIKSTWNMKPLPNKFMSNARATVYYAGVTMATMLFIGEYGPDIINIFKGGWNLILVAFEFLEETVF